jgi:hypothetical protein
MPQGVAGGTTSGMSTGTSAANSNSSTTLTARQITDLPAAGRSLDDLAMKSAPKPVAAAPPPAPENKALARLADKKDESTKLKVSKEEEDRREVRGDIESRMARDAVPLPMSKTGPNRAAGPRQVQQQAQNSIPNDIATRDSGGKHFELRNGAWYDSAYRGGATTNVRRGTEEYKKLDKGLRGIADSIGGVVVVMWKSKAYRIQ